jgi:hypothetical protein
MIGLLQYVNAVETSIVEAANLSQLANPTIQQKWSKKPLTASYRFEQMRIVDIAVGSW